MQYTSANPVPTLKQRLTAHGEGETLSRHKAALTELARKRGLAVGAIYEEIVSGETIAARL